MPSKIVSLPDRQTAIIVQGPGKVIIKNDVPVPALGPNVAIIKTAAVAINPADAKFLDYSTAASVGTILGLDYAGTIVALGADTPAHLSVGDRVAGMVHGMNSLQHDIGAFSEYVKAPADLLLKIPDNMSFEEASSIGTGLATTVLGLWSELEVPASLSLNPKPVDEFVLVSGGSTATGTRAIQLLKLAGLRPIATASPSNFDLATRFGAEKVFDYHSPTCAADIRAYTRNTLEYALDCVSLAESTQLCYGAIGRGGGKYVALEPFREAIATTRPTVDPSWIMMMTIFGHKIALDGEYGRDARPADRELGVKVFKIVQELMDRGMIDTHPVKTMPGGWTGVLKGINMSRVQTFSGYKLVYSIS